MLDLLTTLQELNNDIDIQVSQGYTGKHEWDVTQGELHSKDLAVVSERVRNSRHVHSTYYKLQRTYLVIVLLPPSMLLIKLTFFQLYLQLFAPLRWLRHSIYFGAIFTFCTYTALGTAQLVFSSPKPGGSFAGHLVNSKNTPNLYIAMTMAALGVAIDF